MVAEHWPIISNSSHFVNSRSQHRARTSQRQNSRQVLAIVQDVVSAMVSLHAQSPALHRVLFEETPLPRSLRSDGRRMTTMVAEALVRDTGLAMDNAVVATMTLMSVEALTHRLTLRPSRCR